MVVCPGKKMVTGRVYGENMLRYVVILSGQSLFNCKINCRPFITVSFSLEFPSTNQSYLPCVLQPTYRVLSLLPWICSKIPQAWVLRQTDPNVLAHFRQTENIFLFMALGCCILSFLWQLEGKFGAFFCPLLAIWWWLFSH